MEIRIAEKKDYSRIKGLYSQEGWTRFLNDDLELALDQSIVLVACFDYQVIGFVRVLGDGYITIFIGEIIVNKNFRGKGVGTALINRIISMYPTAQIELISEVDDFYKQLDFKKIGTGLRRFR